MTNATREGRRSRPSLALRTATSVFTVAVFLSVLGASPNAAPAPTPSGFRAIGDIDLHETDRVVIDERAGRLIVVGGGTLNAGDVFLRVSVYDARSLARIGSADFKPYLPQVARVGTSPLIFAFDGARRLLHVLVYESRSDQTNTVNPKLVSVNVDTLKLAGPPKELTLFPRGVRYFGAALWPGGTVGFVGQVIPQVSTSQTGEIGGPELFGVFVGEVDPATAQTTWDPVLVRGCQTAISDQDQAAVAMRAGSVFIGCGTGGILTATAPGTPAVVAIDRTSPTRQRLNVLPGSYAGGDSYFDPVAERLLLVGRAGDRPAQAVWIFDLEHEVFLGEIAAGDFVIRGFAVDPQLGRIYISIGRLAEPGALLVSSDRGIDIPQAQTFPIPAETGPMFAIPSTRSLIVPIEAANKRIVFRVFRDLVPQSAFTVSHLFDYSSYDAFTAAVPQFEGDVQGFGARLHLVGGVGGLAKNAFYIDGADYWPFEATGLKDGDRDLYLGRVFAAHLSQDEASAAAISVDRDDTTESDYTTLARASGGAMSDQWPFLRRDCRDFGSGSEPADEPDATARCEKNAGLSEASATFAGGDRAGLVTIGSASSAGRIRLDPKLGLVAEATAEARHVVIANEVRIARIVSTITVAARGAAGSATATYARAFEGVRAGSFSCSSECDPTTVGRAIADALGAQFRVELPEFDVLETGRGAHAHVLREPWTHQQDVVLSSQDPTERQVPALRLTYTGDNAVGSRLMIEFAGSMGDATYLPFGIDVGGPGGGTVGGPPIAVPSVLPTSITGPAKSTAPPQDGTIRRIVRGIRHGWRFAFALGPRSVALWVVLLLPAFMLARRRELLLLARKSR